MCRAIEMNLFQHGMALPEMISEVDALVFADENMIIGDMTKKQNRAARRAKAASKKHRLGKSWKYANEEITAYWVDNNKVTHWVGDDKECNGLPLEESQSYWNNIPWNKVKGVNPKNCCYKQYNKWDKIVALEKDRRNKRFDIPDMSDLPGVESETPADILEMFGTDWFDLWIAGFDDKGDFEGFDFSAMWNSSNQLWNNQSFRNAVKAYEINKRIKILNDKKQQLLEEYANKIEEINVIIRRDMAKLAEIK